MIDRSAPVKNRLASRYLRETILSVATFPLLILYAVMARGQTPFAPAAQPASDYSKEAFVVESLITKATFENDGTSSRTTTSKVRVQSEAGVQHWGVLTAGYSTANEQVAIDYVRVRKADGSVVETPPDSAQDVTSEVMRVAPMYSDYHEKHVAVKGLGAGDQLEYQITIHQTNPLIPGQFWYSYDFEKSDIVLDEDLEVSIPHDREVKVKSPDIKPEIAEIGNRRVYTWKAKNLKAQNNDEPRREFPAPSILLSSFKSWEEVGRWWNALEQERVTPTPEIRLKAEELTRGATTQEAKVRALYDYVSTHFRYISISFGIGRYQPHAAGEVMKNEYGDCKDKHTLLASLLAAVGIEADPALISSSHHIDPDVPSPGQFDHVITAVPAGPAGGNLLWMDSTAEVAPFGLLLFNLRGKQALIISASQPATLVETPAEPPFKCFRRFEIDANLSNDGVLEGTMKRTLRGDSEVILRAIFRQTPQSQWKDLVQGISRTVGFAGEVSEVEVSSPEDTSKPFEITNKYLRKDYPDWSDHRITPPLGILGFPEIPNEQERTQPLLIGATEEITFVARVKLPEGYTPRLLPPVDLVRDFAEYHSSYDFKDGVFVAETRIQIKQSEVSLSELKQYQSLAKAANEDVGRWTEMRNPAGSPSASASAATANPELREELERAAEAMQWRQLTEASEILAKATKQDPHSQEAWAMLGAVRMAQEDWDGGLVALRKAADLDSDDLRGHKVLAEALTRLHRDQEAVTVLQEMLKRSPHDAGARISLANELMTLKRYDDAIPVLESAVAEQSSSSLQTELGQAYLGAGKTEKGVAVLKDAADSSVNSTTWNDVAYYLADANVSLPDAQRLAEQAVKSAENESTRISLDSLNQDDLFLMTRLVSFWDTLGWVYFRQGNLDKAQKYLEAAWNLGQGSVDGGHLAQIYKKQGKLAEAKHIQSLADSLQERNAPPDPKRIKVPTLAQMDAGEELSQMRHTTLGKLNVARGSGEFFILIVPGGKVQDIKFVSGDERVDQLSKMISGLKFKAPLPDDAPVRIVRRGLLYCPGPSYASDFTLYPIDSVTSVR